MEKAKSIWLSDDELLLIHKALAFYAELAEEDDVKPIGKLQEYLGRVYNKMEVK